MSVMICFLFPIDFMFPFELGLMPSDLLFAGRSPRASAIQPSSRARPLLSPLSLHTESRLGPPSRRLSSRRRVYLGILRCTRERKQRRVEEPRSIVGLGGRCA